MKVAADSWEKAREMRVNGASLSEIARTIGVTRQAVAKKERAQGWLNQTGEPLPTKGMHPKRAVVMNLRRGCSIRVAAEAAGVHPNTVGNWRRQDQNYDAECRAAISQYGVDRIGDLTRASERGDVRATKLALERHQSTKDDFAPDRGREGIEIILNIDRRDTGEPTRLHWPNRPTIEGNYEEITDRDTDQ
jgi:transposase-like protein